MASRQPTFAPARWRNIIIFVAGVWLFAAASWALSGVGVGDGDIAPEESPAMLLFILGPVLMACVLRWWGGDRWADAGLRLRWRGNGGWYLLALLLFPGLSVLALGVGAVFGQVRFASGAAGAFVELFAATLVVRLVYAMFEEWGWRGYLEPRLENLGVSPLRRHLLVAAVWGLWHVPYVMVVGTMSEVPLQVYLPLFLIAMIPMSVIYGVVRQRTGSVWPAVFMHGIANAVAFPLLSAEVVAENNELFFAARPEGLVQLVGLCVVAWALWRKQRVWVHI